MNPRPLRRYAGSFAMPAHDAYPCSKYGLILTCYVNGKKRFRPLCLRTVADFAALHATPESVDRRDGHTAQDIIRPRARAGASRATSRRH